ncbi:hypothetical protein p1B45 (plasmid) [Aromatoleum aromaticum EbN1]|uniref:Uncharacterized protein n=1 Tax=Aromatoleum aromaticum (strain DSM 19018 / LMG 30748 / EbN1) TaxID=76114 RepID=Q5NXD4_AROAE|nr:hypothetical protein p1B45 [Aromatoleum aromaticum EbN1]
MIRVLPIEVRPSGRKGRQGGVVGFVLLFRGRNGGARPTFGSEFGLPVEALTSDVRKASPGSAALPKRPGRRPQRGGVLPSGRRRAAASSVPDGARPEVAFSPEAATRVSRPSPSKPASRSGSSPRLEAQLAVSAEPNSGGDGHHARRERGSSVPLERRVRSATRPCLCALVGGPSEGRRFALTRFVLSTPLP